MTGLKYDEEKPDWSLLPWKEVEEAARVMTYGAKKYKENPNDPNWIKVEGGYHRYFAALMRHLTAERRGEYFDPESGHPHMAHAIFNVLTLSHFARVKHEKLITEAKIKKERESVGVTVGGFTNCVPMHSIERDREPFKEVHN